MSPNLNNFDSCMTAQERDILLKLETGDYILKFGQIYKIKQATLFPCGAPIGGLADKMLNKGFLELHRFTINGVQFKAHTITNYGRKRLLYGDRFKKEL